MQLTLELIFKLDIIIHKSHGILISCDSTFISTRSQEMKIRPNTSLRRLLLVSSHPAEKLDVAVAFAIRPWWKAAQTNQSPLTVKIICLWDDFRCMASLVYSRIIKKSI